MQSLICKLLLTGMIALLVTPTYGEYYQFTDANGRLRFTDDIASVPQEQRPDVKTYESVKSSPDQPTSRMRANGNGSRVSTPSSGGASNSAGTWKEKMSRQADELDRVQEELHKTFVDLQAERSALEAKAPHAGATRKERDAYRDRVDALNAKIERYEEQYAEYKEQEKAFHEQYRK